MGGAKPTYNQRNPGSPFYLLMRLWQGHGDSGEGRNPEGRRGRRQGSYLGVQATIVMSDRCENTSPTLSQDTRVPVACAKGMNVARGLVPSKGRGFFGQP